MFGRRLERIERKREFEEYHEDMNVAFQMMQHSFQQLTELDRSQQERQRNLDELNRQINETKSLIL